MKLGFSVSTNKGNSNTQPRNKIRNTLLLGSIITVALATTVACTKSKPASTQTWEQGVTYNLTILHTNDHHGRFWQNKNGEYGMAARKTLIDSLRTEVEGNGGSLLLLSGGDINTGVPESDLLNAEPDFKGMTKLGYDAMAIGNHEFDNPLEILKQQEEWADFPLLSANIYNKETGERMFQPYAIFMQQGIKVAVIGLTTETTATIGNPEYTNGIEFRDPKAEAVKVIAKLKQDEQPDLIFAATHMGHYDGNMQMGDVALANYVTEGDLDMIVGGHSQEPLCMEAPNVVNKGYKPGDDCMPDFQNGAWIVQAHEWGKYVGRADFQFKDGELTLTNYQLIPVNLKKKVEIDGETQRVFIQDEIMEDPDMIAFLKPFQDKGSDELNVVKAVINGKLEGDRSVVRLQPTNLGHLIAVAQMERANADIGVMNSGGVRDSIAAGNVTYRDVLIVQPFGNIITYTDLTGKEVMDYLAVVANIPAGSGGFAQFAGVSLVADGTGVSDVKIGGEPIDMAKTYRLAVPSFNAAGGDGYPKLADHPTYVNTGFADAEVLMQYLMENSPVDVSMYNSSGDVVYK